jgi:membrane protein required for colicin V production
MQIYDVIMLVVLIGATLFGAWKGLAWQLASLAAIFASYFVAVELRDSVASMIDAAPPWNIFLAMLILYVGTSLVIWIIFRFVSDFIDRLRLKEFDRQIGAVFGLAKGLVLCVLITLFAVALLGEAQRRTIIDSFSGRKIAHLLDRAHVVMPSEIHDVIGPYIHSLDGSDPNHGSGPNHGSAEDEVHEALVSPFGEQLIPVKELFQALEKGTPIPGNRRR